MSPYMKELREFRSTFFMMAPEKIAEASGLTIEELIDVLAHAENMFGPLEILMIGFWLAERRARAIEEVRELEKLLGMK